MLFVISINSLSQCSGRFAASILHKTTATNDWDHNTSLCGLQCACSYKYILCLGLQLGRSRVRVFGVGQWFVPCRLGDEACADELAAKVAEGGIPAFLAGWLHFDGSLRPFIGGDIGAGGGVLGEKVRFAFT